MSMNKMDIWVGFTLSMVLSIKHCVTILREC